MWAYTGSRLPLSVCASHVGSCGTYLGRTLGGVRPASILWAPGAASSASSIQRLANAIHARTAFGEEVLVGAKGQASAANAVRALGLATRAGHHAVEFRAHWEELLDEDGAVALRFCAEQAGYYDRFTRLGWAEARPLIVAAPTSVASLARAMASDLRNAGRCVVHAEVGFSKSGELRASTSAKALASVWRYTKGKQTPWCIAAHAPGNILRLHIFAVGTRLHNIED